LTFKFTAHIYCRKDREYKKAVWDAPIHQREDMNGEIIEVSFLGGLLHGYRRERRAA